MSTVEDLRVYALARALVPTVWEVTEGLRHDGGLRDQMRRAAVSVVSNIVEGHARRNPREFRNFLRYARASCDELRVQAEMLQGIREHAQMRCLITSCSACGKMLTRLIQSMATMPFDPGRRL